MVRQIKKSGDADVSSNILKNRRIEVERYAFTNHCDKGKQDKMFKFYIIREVETHDLSTIERSIRQSTFLFLFDLNTQYPKKLR